jgi:integrase
MKNYLKGKNLRDWCLFTVGINVALRCSDLLSLTIGDVMDEKGKIRERIRMRETKNDNLRNIMISPKAAKAIKEYLASRDGYSLEDPLFPSRKGGGKKPLLRRQVGKILSVAAAAVGIKEPISTHSMRKTFGYHSYKKGYGVEKLQKLFGHSSPGITLDYIGISQDDLDEIYLKIDL